jgi:hypothetical protein
MDVARALGRNHPECRLRATARKSTESGVSMQANYGREEGTNDTEYFPSSAHGRSGARAFFFVELFGDVVDNDRDRI